MLQNEYFTAKISFDTAENEPFESWQFEKLILAEFDNTFAAETHFSLRTWVHGSNLDSLMLAVVDQPQENQNLENPPSLFLSGRPFGAMTGGRALAAALSAAVVAAVDCGLCIEERACISSQVMLESQVRHNYLGSYFPTYSTSCNCRISK